MLLYPPNNLHLFYFLGCQLSFSTSHHENMLVEYLTED